ncbi:MAG: hypothetical protein Q8N53_05970 [Longimicrobiales bacterium]|nr:hypothetical protein [Longimicrobiales bacterium]
MFPMIALLALSPIAASCGDDGLTDPDTLHVGQVGSIVVRLEVPLRLGEGKLTQELQWRSSGAWALHEAISYRGLTGDESRAQSSGDHAQLAVAYDSVIAQLNTRAAVQLFIADLPTELVPPCDATHSRITFTIRDDARNRSTTWIRCATGSLDNLTPEGAGPDPAASRVVLAALLTRQATVGSRWTWAYQGSVPFGTLDRGGNSGSHLGAPAAYIDVGGFNAFWAGHAPGRAPPAVDFTKDMVVVGIVGVRREAGDSVEVRRVLQVDLGTVLEVVERVPGNYCSPAAKTHVPYHVVVTPRSPIPHRFADIRLELVSCGA